MLAISKKVSLGSKSRKLCSVVASVALSACLLGCSDSNSSSSSAVQFDPEVADTFKTVLANNMEIYEIPGALVGIWVPGKGELVMADGVSDLVTNEALTLEDHMRVGSVTKSFTVTVILQMIDEGLLSLDDPLSRFFPDMQNSDATIADLANMRSGIFNYTEDGDFVELLVQDFLRKWTPQELVDVAERNAPYFTPDGGWHYSNTSTVILGMIIEQLSGNPARVEIQQRIIDPLALDGTSYPTSADLPPPFSHGYLWAGPEEGLMDVTLTDPSSSAASGAMISKLSDLRKWAEALGRGTLISADMQRKRVDSLQPVTFNPCADGDPVRAPRVCPDYDKYGFGMGELDGWIGHTGESLGYTALVMFEPETSAVIVVLMNKSGVADHTHVPTTLFRAYANILKEL